MFQKLCKEKFQFERFSVYSLGPSNPRAGIAAMNPPCLLYLQPSLCLLFAR